MNTSRLFYDKCQAAAASEYFNSVIEIFLKREFIESLFNYEFLCVQEDGISFYYKYRDDDAWFYGAKSVVHNEALGYSKLSGFVDQEALTKCIVDELNKQEFMYNDRKVLFSVKCLGDIVGSRGWKQWLPPLYVKPQKYRKLAERWVYTKAQYAEFKSDTQHYKYKSTTWGERYMYNIYNIIGYQLEPICEETSCGQLPERALKKPF